MGVHICVHIHRVWSVVNRKMKQKITSSRDVGGCCEHDTELLSGGNLQSGVGTGENLLSQAREHAWHGMQDDARPEVRQGALGLLASAFLGDHVTTMHWPWDASFWCGGVKKFNPWLPPSLFCWDHHQECNYLETVIELVDSVIGMKLNHPCPSSPQKLF